MAEHVRALDPTRLVTNGVNVALLPCMDEVAADRGEPRESETSAGDGDMGDVMNLAAEGENVTRRTAESHAVLDVVGLNYGDSRYALDRELFPHRVIVGSETFPIRIGTLWPMVLEHPHVIGDFTWTGWDYLGEVGIGATAYAEDSGRRRRPRARVPVPDRLVRRPGHHRVATPGQLLPRDRVRAADRAVHRGAPPGAPRRTRSRCSPRGPGATRSPRGRGPGSRARP